MNRSANYSKYVPARERTVIIFVALSKCKEMYRNVKKYKTGRTEK